VVWTYRENRTCIAERSNSLDCIPGWPSSKFTFELTSAHVGLNHCVFFIQVQYWNKKYIIQKSLFYQFDIHGSMHRRYISKCNQQNATLHNLFISVKCSTCFRWKYRLKHVEHFTEINKLCNVASRWLYLEIYLFYHLGLCLRLSH
jgi:hypothetical protein